MNLEYQEKEPLVYIVILNWNNAPDTIECLQSLEKSNYLSYVPLVIDNGSTNGAVEDIRDRFSAINVIELEENLGYAVGNNVGIQHAMEQGAEYVLILNNDTIVEPNMISELIKFAESNPGAGMVGPKMYCAEPEDTIFATGSFIEWGKGNTFNRGMFQNDSNFKSSTDPEKVDFITSVGHLEGGNTRQEAGLIGKGPVAVISQWGVYDFAPDSKRMRAKTLTPGIPFDIAQQTTGFELLKPEGEIPESPMITEEILRILRTDVDPNGVFTTMPS